MFYIKRVSLVLLLLLIGMLVCNRAISQDSTNSHPTVSSAERSNDAKEKDTKDKETERKNLKAPLADTLTKTKPDIKWEVSAGKVFWSVLIFLMAYWIMKYLTQGLELISERWSRSRLFIKKVIPMHPKRPKVPYQCILVDHGRIFFRQ